MKKDEREAFDIMSKAIYEARINLERLSRTLGHPVKITILTAYLLIVLVSGCLCFPYADDLVFTPQVNITSELGRIEDGKFIPTPDDKEVKPIETTTTTTLRIQYLQAINYVNINRTLDISPIQRHELYNLKPDLCNSASCSDGFFKCKTELFHIMEFPSIRYSEKWSSNAYQVIKKQEETPQVWLPVRNEGAGSYLRLNSSFWYIVTVNDSIILYTLKGWEEDYVYFLNGTKILRNESELNER